MRVSSAEAFKRGFRPPTEESFAQDVGPEGALYVGSPETVADKIATDLKLLGAPRRTRSGSYARRSGRCSATGSSLKRTVAPFGR